jgi:hypothetical protein
MVSGASLPQSKRGGNSYRIPDLEKIYPRSRVLKSTGSRGLKTLAQTVCVYLLYGKSMI